MPPVLVALYGPTATLNEPGFAALDGGEPAAHQRRSGVRDVAVTTGGHRAVSAEGAPGATAGTNARRSMAGTPATATVVATLLRDLTELWESASTLGGT
ncbi:hypothetical protein GCM10020218_069330 [Dactylosporangium vinaceum]